MNRALTCAVGAFFVVAGAAGCAKRIPEPVNGHTDSPHIGWIIMSGDAVNPDRDFICQSGPSSECVLPADRPNARVVGHVHLYYHPAAADTKYSGSIRIEFFDRQHEIDPNMTVKAGAPPGNQSVADFVSSTPGTYSMTIAVVATLAPSGAIQQIREQVRVTVK